MINDYYSSQQNATLASPMGITKKIFLRYLHSIFSLHLRFHLHLHLRLYLHFQPLKKMQMQNEAIQINEFCVTVISFLLENFSLINSVACWISYPLLNGAEIIFSRRKRCVGTSFNHMLIKIKPFLSQRIFSTMYF